MATVSVTPSMQAHADLLLAETNWSRGVDLRTGRVFVAFAGSKGEIHRADADACTCKGFYHRLICAHVVAIREQAASDGLADVSHDDVADPAHDFEVERAFADAVSCRSCGGRTASTRESWCSACRRRLLQLDDD
jgi:hypothetical protein